MTTNTVKRTPDATDSIADDLLRNGYERWLRLEEEKAAIGDDLKELFAELKGQGFTPKALRESFRRVRNADSADQQEHDAIVDLYVASLTRARPARTREASYSEAKGRGFVAKLTDEQMAAALAYDGEDSPVGELTDNQESEPCLGHATEHSAYVGTAPDENPAQDDAVATASSTDSNPQPTKGESDAKSAHDDSVFEEHLIGRRRQDAATAERQQPTEHENAPTESAADTISATNSNSQASPLKPANKAGEAPSSPASPAALSDDLPISTTPSFAARPTGEFPDIPAFLDRRQPKAREWEEA